jgi:hypothetical protein
VTALLSDAALVEAVTIVMNTVQLLVLAYIAATVGDSNKRLRR